MPISRWSGCSFLSIDPGINYTGFAQFMVPALKEEPVLVAAGAISVPDNEVPWDRLPYLLAQIEIHARKRAFVFLERPPDTVYYQGKQNPAQLIARAQSVFKLVGVATAIYACLHLKHNMPIRGILPQEWQERSPKKRMGRDIKEWSVEFANTVRALSNLEPLEHTPKNENIADAISLGYRAYMLGLSPS